MISMIGTGLGKQLADAKRIGFTLVSVVILGGPCTSMATITDFTTWTLAQDPAHPNFTGSTVAAQATSAVESRRSRAKAMKASTARDWMRSLG